jgi:hypothetical protein
MDVVKIDRDVAHCIFLQVFSVICYKRFEKKNILSVSDVCCTSCIFLQVFQLYIVSVLKKNVLSVSDVCCSKCFCLDVAYISHTYCNCFI